MPRGPAMDRGTAGSRQLIESFIPELVTEVRDLVVETTDRPLGWQMPESEVLKACAVAGRPDQRPLSVRADFR